MITKQLNLAATFKQYIVLIFIEVCYKKNNKHLLNYYKKISVLNPAAFSFR